MKGRDTQGMTESDGEGNLGVVRLLQLPLQAGSRVKQATANTQSWAGQPPMLLTTVRWVM